MLRYGYNVSVSTISTRKSDMRYLFCSLRLKITGSSHFLTCYVSLGFIYTSLMSINSKLLRRRG